MKKVKVIIPANSEHYIIEHTIATLLRNVDATKFDITIHLGLHSNYSHYTDNLSIFKNLDGHASIHLVDELDWQEHNANKYRYSLMHSLNLINLIHHVKYYEFDYLAILDNDLEIKKDFLTDLLDQEPDLVCSLMNDVNEPVDVIESGTGDNVKFMPKISVWHTVISRKMFDYLLDNLKLIKPHVDNNIVYDTFARFYNKIRNNKDFDIKILKESEFKKYIHHFTCSSFNYGLWAQDRNHDKYKKNIANIKNRYLNEFPNGVSEILENSNRKMSV